MSVNDKKKTSVAAVTSPRRTDTVAGSVCLPPGNTVLKPSTETQPCGAEERRGGGHRRDISLPFNCACGREMASLSSSKLQTKMSAWTPLNHPAANSRVFSERRTLLVKWFDKWSESQRKCVLQDFLSRSSVAQLRCVRSRLEQQIPLQAVDFTCMLPRVLSLFIFSYLDPRSLCRCAQVSWHWRGIVELDQLWMPKCLRLGWTLPFSPTPHETSVWKRLYVEMVKKLRTARPLFFMVPEVAAIRPPTPPPPDQALFDERWGRGSGRTRDLPPWRHADRHPKDTLRFNYLSNLDPVDQAKHAQMRGSIDHMRKSLSASSYKLRKARSQMMLSSLDPGLQLQTPPPSLLPSPTSSLISTPPPSTSTPQPDASGLGRSHPLLLRRPLRYHGNDSEPGGCNAGIRPGPVRAAVPRLSAEALRVCQRSSNTPPSVPLFESQPWTPHPGSYN
ncbi:F-box only protein 16 [Merluccius polli]|uniref:F-box only protein 16 n=1 Tax=Merluccius polli TaxID=89951 RepID=A0AA47NP65_MERPO|nr:F-box only protein 16 [Merluccius polli]